ncbi:hypothetical protein SPHI_28210 [Sphingomonas jeddahensis]|uniref:Uncharacterized protein n=1 Tax=Sphingomonas jeddahensis TaxID=1915074 RepID=A0A1V2ES16_9SPHN|nr:hypothetical protein SPHI_28210 [Sphingomonas jeddahensis]
MHQRHRQRGIRRHQHGLHHRSALVRLRHHPVRAMQRRTSGHRPRPPLGRRAVDARVGDYIAAAILAQRDTHDPARIAADTRRRIDPHHHTPQRRRRRHPASFDQPARPQGPDHRVDQLAVELLPPERRPAITLAHRVHEAFRQMHVAPGLPNRLLHARQRHHPPHQRVGPGRRRHHHLRPRAQPHGQHQIVPCRIAAPPFRQLVAPRRMMLRPAQALRRIGRIDRRHRPAGPAHLAFGRRPHRPHVEPRRRDHPARPLHHHPPRLVRRRADQCDPRARNGARDMVDPFRPRARLAEPAPRADQPDAPVARRRKLSLMSIMALPAPRRLDLHFHRQHVDHPIALVGRQQG